MLAFADLIAKRAALRWLAQQHPQWTHQDLADALSMSRSWVSKWFQRLLQADADDIMALHSRTPPRHTPPASIASQPAVVQRILEIRLAPPENLQRVPGPEAILYYVHRDPALQQAAMHLPRSQTTIWKILRQAGCIAQDRRRKPKPLEPRQKGGRSSVRSERWKSRAGFRRGQAATCGGDRQLRRCWHLHLVAPPGAWRFRCRSALRGGGSVFVRTWLAPDAHAFSMTPALSVALREGLSPLRLCASCSVLECNRVLIPPRRPDLNAYVERFHRSLGQECLQIHRPATLSQVAEFTEAFLAHYNQERPNQARSCGNQPPRVAYPAFPTLPAVPQTVDPDYWLVQVHKRAFARTVRAKGDLTINCQNYYVSRTLAGQRVTCWVNAAEKHFEIWQPGKLIKTIPIKGLYGKTMPFEEYVELMKREARSEYQQYVRTHPRLTQGRLWS